MKNKQPNSVYAEEAVIGSIILEPTSERCQNALRSLTADMFYSRVRQTIFEALAFLNTNQKPIDLITLENELTVREAISNIGGIAYLAELCKVPVTVNVSAYVDAIKNNYLERIAMNTLAQCAEELMEKNGLSTQEKLDRVQQTFSFFDAICQQNTRGGLIDLHAIRDQWLVEVEARYTDPNNTRGMTMGIGAFDEILAPKGLVKGSLLVVGARPKMGKTAMLVQMALHCAMKEKRPSVIFSLEMSADQLFERMITQVSGVSSDVFYDATKSEYQFNIALNAVGEIIQNGHIFIDDTPAISLSHIVSECRRMKREKGQIGMVFIDYLTLMKPEKAERNDLAYGAITKGLKALAKELSSVVVLITQLNRNLENRTGDKRPYPSDSRDTGQIEQDCDYWFGLYRDRVYNENADPHLTEIILRLNRHGKTGRAYVDMKYGQLFELDQLKAQINIQQTRTENQSKKRKKYSDLLLDESW